MECPRCGFSQPAEQYCAQCGIHIQNALKARQRKVWLGSLLMICLFAATGIVLYRWQFTREPGKPDHEVQDRERQPPASSPATRPSSPVKTPGASRPRPQAPSPRASEPAKVPEAPPATFSAPPPVKRMQPAEADDRKPAKVLAESVGNRTSNPMTVDRKEKVAKKPAAADPEAQIRKWAAQEWFAKGQELADNSEDELIMYERALEVAPHFAPAHYYSALIYLEWGEYEQAVEAFRRFWADASEAEKTVYPLPEEVYPEDVLPEEGAETTR